MSYSFMLKFAISGKSDKSTIYCEMDYGRTLMAQTPLRLWKFVRDRGSSSHWGFIIEPGQET